MTFILHLKAVDCVAMMCMHNAIKNRTTDVWFMPYKMDDSMCEWYKLLFADIPDDIPEPHKVMVPIKQETTNHWYVAVFSIRTCVVNVWDTDINEAHKVERNNLVKEVVWRYLLTLLLYHVKKF